MHIFSNNTEMIKQCEAYWNDPWIKQMSLCRASLEREPLTPELRRKLDKLDLEITRYRITHYPLLGC